MLHAVSLLVPTQRIATWFTANFCRQPPIEEMDFMIALSTYTNWDNETIQPQDIIAEHGLDPFLDPARLPSADAKLLYSPPAPLTPHTVLVLSSPSQPPLDLDALLDDGDSDVALTSDSEARVASTPDRTKYALSQHGLPFPSRVFTPTERPITRVRLVVSPPHPSELKSIFYVNRPCSPLSDDGSDN